MWFFRYVILIFLALALGCLPQFSGSNHPTDQTHSLTAEDIAYAERTDCFAEFTGDPAVDLAADKAYFKERGVKIKLLKSDVWRFATALRGTLLLPKGFYDKPEVNQARITGHERGHYCQRDEFKGNDFERAYALSNNRFRFEVPNYRYGLRRLKAYGVSDEALCREIGTRIPKFRDSYWLHDLEPVQFEREMRRILEMEVESGC